MEAREREKLVAAVGAEDAAAVERFLGDCALCQLVEAAESCQVAIIHPGKPRDPNEAGLTELLARAEPFR